MGLFYNNGHTERLGYTSRLVVWGILGAPVSGSNSFVWTEPEILLYWHGVRLDDREDWNEDWAIVDGAGYFDLWETSEAEDRRVLVVASNKLTVRIHELDRGVLDGMRVALAVKTGLAAPPTARRHLVQDGLNSVPWLHRPLAEPVFTVSGGSKTTGNVFRAPVLPDVRAGGSFSVVVELGVIPCGNQLLVDGLTEASAALDEPEAGQQGASVKDSRIKKGITVGIVDGGASLELRISDGFSASPTVISAPMGQRIAFIIDGGAGIATSVTDGKVDNRHPQGWRRLDPRGLGEIGGSDFRILSDSVRELKIFHRALRHFECPALPKEVRACM